MGRAGTCISPSVETRGLPGTGAMVECDWKLFYRSRRRGAI